jgi:hypothetical protein
LNLTRSVVGYSGGGEFHLGGEGGPGGPATSQGGVWIRIASSRSHPTVLASPRSLSQLAWRALCPLADAPMLPGWEVSGRGHWAQLPRDPWTLPQKAGERPPKRRPLVRPGARTLGRLATYRPRRSCTALSRGKLTRPQACETTPHAWWRRATLLAIQDASEFMIGGKTIQCFPAD